jgi:hypothetical protein
VRGGCWRDGNGSSLSPKNNEEKDKKRKRDEKGPNNQVRLLCAYGNMHQSPDRAAALHTGACNARLTRTSIGHDYGRLFSLPNRTEQEAGI